MIQFGGTEHGLSITLVASPSRVLNVDGGKGKAGRKVLSLQDASPITRFASVGLAGNLGEIIASSETNRHLSAALTKRRCDYHHVGISLR